MYTPIKQLAITLILFTLLTSIAFADSETKTYLIGLEEGTDSAIVAQYGTITDQFNAVNIIAAQLTQEAAAQLAQEPAITFVEENKEMIIQEEPTTPPPMQIIGDSIKTLGDESPTEPILPWNLNTTGINALEAWVQFGAQGDGIKIAFIGTGVNYTLPDLSEQYLGGYDFGNDDPDSMPTSNSGTQRASAAIGKGITVKGVAPNAQYYTIKIFTDSGTFPDYLKTVAGINWAIEHQANIVLLDWAETGEIYPVRDAIRIGYSKGLLFIGRAGDASNQKYPAYYDKLISVGAYKEDQSLLETTQPYNVSVVAPGDDILVLNRDGTIAVDSGSDIAAAHVVGALALMLDYNKAHNKGYSNSDIWKTLNYSAVWLDEQEAENQGFGKADVNAALTWMEQGWYVDYAIEYLNPDAMEGETPVYYLGNDVEYQLTIANDSNKDFSSLEVSSYHINLEGEHAFEKIEQAPEDHSTINNLLANTSQTIGPYTWTTTTETEPGQKGTEIKVQIGPTIQPLLGPGPTLTMTENSFVLRPAPPGTFLHLIEMPSYSVEEPLNSSGAAVAKMILDYVRNAAGYLGLAQSEIYAYAAPEEGQDFNAYAMDAVLGHFDPYDEKVVNYYDRYDSLHDGNPFQGYNYTIDYYDNIEGYIKDIVQWMAYPVTREQWWLHGELVETANTPAALPIYGSYNHWVAVNGYAVSEDPTPDPFDPWTIKPFTVYGFWLTDPAQGGIGQHVYVTAAEATATYFLPMTGGTPYDGKYLQIAEPPAMPPEENSPMIMAMALRDGGQEESIAMPLETSNQGTSETSEPIVQIAKPVPNKKNLEIVKNAIETAGQTK